MSLRFYLHEIAEHLIEAGADLVPPPYLSTSADVGHI